MFTTTRSMVYWIKEMSGRPSHPQIIRPRKRGYMPWADMLEDRTAPATFSVLNLNDAAIAPANSLRAAVNGVLASTDPTNNIIFNGELTGDLGLVQALPNINKSVGIFQGLGTGRVNVTRAPGAGNFRIFKFDQVPAGTQVWISAPSGKGVRNLFLK